MVTKAIDDICEQNSIKSYDSLQRLFSSSKKILFDLCDSEVLTLTRQMQFLPLWPLKRYLGRVLICGRPARCKRFLKKIGTSSDAAICPASDAAMELRACMGVRGPEPNHNCLLQARLGHLFPPDPSR